MKAFTVYQPYAYAIVAGLKGYETRQQRTNIRGRVAVHAGRRNIKQLLPNEVWDLLGTEEGKLRLSIGAVVGTVEIVGCVPVEDIISTLPYRELMLGDYSPGRWAWVLKNPVMFSEPVTASGKQGWWNWEGGNEK